MSPCVGDWGLMVTCSNERRRRNSRGAPKEQSKVIALLKFIDHHTTIHPEDTSHMLVDICFRFNLRAARKADWGPDFVAILSDAGAGVYTVIM
ncbi:hypothetical protein AGOR_G00246410 [Albula goreensis]|uniref:Uncharacterized protein n=1 Tax=Albula goreensis TaxID=1534307 RepID=A0A8T3CD97_9TELE|nr:hypothetical protein AGOR_G00246410 [Albula goreensis]